ncbi:unnamed protein product [Prunus brigantina]
MEKKLIEILIWVSDETALLDPNEYIWKRLKFLVMQLGFSLVKKTWHLDQKHLIISLVTMNKMKMMKETAPYDLKRPKLITGTKWASFGPKRPKLSVIMNLAAEDGGACAGFWGGVGDG